MDDAAPAVAGIGRDTRLRITEIFLSLQGESTRVGLPTVFVRLTGCPLRCHYCDTAYAFHGGKGIDLADVLSQVEKFGVEHVCVTGGEPLAQRSSLSLMMALCDAGYNVSIETSGALDISAVDPRVSRIVDIKTPASGEVTKNRWDNLGFLHARDEVKFVICNRADYDWACDVLRDRQLSRLCTVLFSPSHEQLAPADLAQWIVDDRLPVRFQMQLHKALWGATPGR